jgi:3-hydroxyisobutyrate dehydrogenase-like beta-hydroxyacid dehydrogenase
MLSSGTVVGDMTSGSPEMGQARLASAQARGIGVIEAPVGGVYQRPGPGCRSCS